LPAAGLTPQIALRQGQGDANRWFHGLDVGVAGVVGFGIARDPRIEIRWFPHGPRLHG